MEKNEKKIELGQIKMEKNEKKEPINQLGISKVGINQITN